MDKYYRTVWYCKDKKDEKGKIIERGCGFINPMTSSVGVCERCNIIFNLQEKDKFLVHDSWSKIEYSGKLPVSQHPYVSNVLVKDARSNYNIDDHINDLTKQLNDLTSLRDSMKSLSTSGV